jgi:hypothetical protein
MNLPSRHLAAERNAIRVCLLIAMAFVMLGVSEFWINSTRSFHGRWGWLREFLFDNFGTAGVAAMWFMFAAAPLLFARSIWRHASRVPSDRWYRD